MLICFLLYLFLTPLPQKKPHMLYFVININILSLSSLISCRILISCFFFMGTKERKQTNRDRETEWSWN